MEDKLRDVNKKLISRLKKSEVEHALAKKASQEAAAARASALGAAHAADKSRRMTEEQLTDTVIECADLEKRLKHHEGLLKDAEEQRDSAKNEVSRLQKQVNSLEKQLEAHSQQTQAESTTEQTDPPPHTIVDIALEHNRSLVTQNEQAMTTEDKNAGDRDVRSATGCLSLIKGMIRQLWDAFNSISIVRTLCRSGENNEQSLPLLQ